MTDTNLALSTAPPTVAALTQLLHEARLLRDVQPRKGLAQALRARRLARQLAMPPEEAWALHHGAVAACRLGRRPLAWRLCDAASALFVTLDDRRGEAMAANLQGILSYDDGDPVGAYRRYDHSLALARDLGLITLEGKVLGNLSLTAHMLGDLSTALTWALEALTVARAAGDTEQVARLLVNGAELALSLGLGDQAQRLATEGFALAAGLDRPPLVISALLSVAGHHAAEGRHDIALGAAREAARLASVQDGPREQVMAGRILARSLLATAQYGEAGRVVTDTLTRAATANLADWLMDLMVLQGQILTAQGQWEQAREPLREALSLAEELQRPVERCAALFALAELEEQVGDARAALTAFRAFHDLDRRLFGERQAQRAQALLVTHEVAEHRRLSEQLQAANRSLQYAADHDELTGALNRRAFLALADGQVEAWVTRAFGLLLLDVDDFKSVNDRFGHGVGDHVLRAVVEVLRAQVPAGGAVCRWGGEEFIVLLPHAGRVETARVGEQVRAAVEAFAWGDVHAGLRVTVSVGAGAEDMASGMLEERIAAVDAALYRAKRSGRNRVVMAAGVAT